MAKRRFRRARRYYSRIRRSSRKMTIPILPVVGIVSAPSLRNAVGAIQQGNLQNALSYMAGLVGFDASGKWYPQFLYDNWIPIIAGFVGHKVASIIGINAMLGKAKVPLLRL